MPAATTHRSPHRLRWTQTLALALPLIAALPRDAEAQTDGPQLLGIAVADTLPVGEERIVSASFGHSGNLDPLYQAHVMLARADGAAGCAVFYERTTNTLGLRTDNGQYINLGSPGGAAAASSSWCALHAERTRAIERNGVLTVDFALTVQPRLEGVAQVFETAVDRDGRAAPTVRQATVRIGRGPLPPSTVSVDLDAVTAGRASVLTATYGDPNSWPTLTETYLVAADTVGGEGCYVRYLPSTNMLQLRTAGDTWVDAGAPGGDGGAMSAACAMNPRTSSVSGNGEYVTVRYAITFAADFAGQHRLFLLAVDDANLRTYWDDRGGVLVGATPAGVGSRLTTLARTQLLTWGGLFALVTLLAAALRMSPRIGWGGAAAALLVAGTLATLRIAVAEQVATLALALLVLGVVLELRDRWKPLARSRRSA
jgi:hypothetical protein